MHVGESLAVFDAPFDADTAIKKVIPRTNRILFIYLAPDKFAIWQNTERELSIDADIGIWTLTLKVSTSTHNAATLTQQKPRWAGLIARNSVNCSNSWKNHWKLGIWDKRCPKLQKIQLIRIPFVQIVVHDPLL